MPKRSYDTSDMSASLKMLPMKIQKTERSHEENQERAYIAASRRADRSLEARVQSARMASDIHRKRTGRGLKVSEEIVLKEEMYEEMEDDMPRSYEHLAAHLQTDSPELNNRVRAYIASQTAMATIAKYNEVNKKFSEAFPRVAHFSKQPRSLYVSPLLQNHPSSPCHSTSTLPQTSERNTPMSNASPGHTPTTISAPTPELSPATTSTDAMEPIGTPYQVPQSVFPDPPVDRQPAQHTASSFTSELPNEVKMMADIDLSDPMAMHFLGAGASSAFTMLDEYDKGAPSLQGVGASHLDSYGYPKTSDEYCTAFFPSLGASIECHEAQQPDGFGQLDSRYGAPAVDIWESFVDFDTEP